MHHNNQNEWRRVSLGRQIEESSLPGGDFAGRYARELRWEALILTLVLGAIGAVQLTGRNWAGAAFFLALGAAMLVLTQVLWSYRLHVDRERIREGYWILCFHRRREVLWRELRGKKVRCSSRGEAISIRLYDRQGRQRLHLTYEVVGFGKILKRAKALPKQK